jgi:DNA-binding NtrC family response regulator
MSGTPAHRILIADDHADIIEALRLLLKNEGYQTEAVKSPAAAVKAVEARDYSLALIDLNYARDTTSGKEGLDLLSKLQSIDPTLPVVIMTAWANVELAVEAMRRGARDFIAKPWENLRLIAIVKNQIELGGTVRAYRRLEQENQLLRGKQGPALIAQSAAMRPVLELIARVGPSDANVLITGENGTGKGLVAQAIHAVSARGTRPFISVNMGGLPEGVFESELFGHVRGAFTGATSNRRGLFEEAAGGTIFLDEIGELPLSLQPKLLRALEGREVRPVGSNAPRAIDVRVVAATNRRLARAVNDGSFREDLYYRLAVVEIVLPPLRDRAEDIVTLANLFHAGITGADGTLSPQVLESLRSRSWPGNVRELRNFVERSALLGWTTPEPVEAPPAPAPATSLEALASADLPLKEARDHCLVRFEALYITALLRKTRGNVTRAAGLAGVSRRYLHRLILERGLRGGVEGDPDE